MPEDEEIEAEKPKRRSKKPSEEKGEPEGFVWTTEAVKDLEEFIGDLANKYVTYKRDEAEAKRKSFEAMAKHNRNMVITLVLFLVAIVVGMSYLALKGHVTGDALLFLVGTITGYVLMFIQRLVFTSRQVPLEEIQAE